MSNKNSKVKISKPRLFDKYNTEVIPKLIGQFKYKNKMQAPKLSKIVLSVCTSEALQNMKALESAVNDLGIITGQKAIIRKSKKAISAFKLQANVPIGCMTTLRKQKMYEFFDRLVSIALPRVRDFKGLDPKSFDGRGNYTFGIKEQIIFPEINYDKIDKIRGMNITIGTTAHNDIEAKALLTELGMPFRDRQV